MKKIRLDILKIREDSNLYEYDKKIMRKHRY